MAKKESLAKTTNLNCCPELPEKPVCDSLRLRYRLPFRPRNPETGQRLPVEVCHCGMLTCRGLMAVPAGPRQHRIVRPTVPNPKEPN